MKTFDSSMLFIKVHRIVLKGNVLRYFEFELIGALIEQKNTFKRMNL